MDLGVKDRRFVVTGGSRGLGWAAAECLDQEGALVMVASRTPPARTGGRITWRHLDTSDPTSIEDFLTNFPWSSLQGLMLNTGGPRPGHFSELMLSDWHEAFQSLLMAPVLLVNGLLERMDPGASVLFNTSSSVKVPIDSLLLSNVLRPAVSGLAKSLSLELGSRGIRVNVIAPGRISTERIAELDGFHAAAADLSLDQVRQSATARIPLGRYGRPEEFGRSAAFLLSPSSSYISGATLFVDGGQTRAL